MTYYQLSYLISPELSPEEAEIFSDKIASIVTNVGGILEKTEKPQKKSLAYKIKKQGVAYLTSVYFNLDPENAKELEKALKKESQILRFLLFKDKIQKEEIIPIAPQAKTPPSFQLPELPQKKEKVEEKIELGDIEKTLKEILGQ